MRFTVVLRISPLYWRSIHEPGSRPGERPREQFHSLQEWRGIYGEKANKVNFGGGIYPSLPTLFSGHPIRWLKEFTVTPPEKKAVHQRSQAFGIQGKYREKVSAGEIRKEAAEYANYINILERHISGKTRNSFILSDISFVD